MTRPGDRTAFVLLTTGLLLVVVVSITGGFVLDAGPVRLSVRNPIRPLLLAAAMLVWLFVRGGVGVVRTLAADIWPFVERRTTLIAVVLAAAAAAGGIAWNTYAASGSDAAGYVSQANSMAHGRLTMSAPLGARVSWPDAAHTFSPLAYRPGPSPGELVPTYPPGLPLVMAAAQLAGGELAPYLVVPLLGAVAVFSVFTLGRRLHSPVAGLVAAVLLATSPIFLFEVAQPMSDVAAATWWVVSLTLAARGSVAGAVAAGLAAGLGFLTRPVTLPMLLPVAMTLAMRGGRVTALASLGAALAPFLAGLALLQQRFYGTPFGSGHGTIGEMFGLSNIPENLSRYTSRLVTGETAMLALLAAAALFLALFPKVFPPSRHSPGALRSIRHPALIAAVSLAIVIVSYLPYVAFEEWWYLRFFLPALPPMFVAAGAVMAVAATHVPASLRGPVLLLALVVAGSFNIVEARRQEAFLVRRSEARYQIVGAYLAGMLPANAIVISSQHSASAHHYARRPIARWDTMAIGLDTAVADLVAIGQHPFLVLEEWEEPQVRKQFPDSVVARLDWRPVADIGDLVRVRIYDALNRRAGPAATHPRVDRIHAP